MSRTQRLEWIISHTYNHAWTHVVISVDVLVYPMLKQQVFALTRAALRTVLAPPVQILLYWPITSALELMVLS